MDRINRRQVVQGVAAAAGAMTLGAPFVHAQNRSTLRFVAQADLRILDPVWTTGYITRNHSYLVYDTLFGTDENLQVKPQMVDRDQRVSRWHEVHVHAARRFAMA
jgi:peptide/nickel transport system substrate-binding protein